ncbi:MAG TPA: hypothetical protein VFL45_07365 [Gammaproteobacteria bacterium]|jgi:hypothetical protein|nr:hypothetical protein [Gammaproteobacteria bacterium]
MSDRDKRDAHPAGGDAQQPRLNAITDAQPGTSGAPSAQTDKSHRWNAFGVIVASLVGLMALLVSGYTAYIERQQVRAQVWPHLMVAYQDLGRKLTVFNKGVGPALVRGVRVTVDGKPQPDWDHVLRAVNLSLAGYGHSTLAGAVLSPGDAVAVLVLPDEQSYARFRKAMTAHVLMDICYCSTLGDCWMFMDRHPPDRPVVQAVDRCPRLPSGSAFSD